MKDLKPLVVESYRNIKYNGSIYTRRLRISRYTASLIDEEAGTNLFGNSESYRFLVLDKRDIKVACKVLEIKYKPISTYFDINLKMCSFK